MSADEVHDSRTTMRDHLFTVFNRFVAVAKRRSAVDVVKTGIAELDRCTGGFAAGELVIVGGRPGSGKTALCFEIARNRTIGTQSGGAAQVLFVAAGERSSKLVERFLSTMSGVPLNVLRDARLQETDFLSIVATADETHKAKILFFDGLYPSVSTVSSAIRELKGRIFEAVDQEECELVEPPLVFIDSIQQLTPITERPNRHQELTDTIREIKRAADETRSVVIATSPLNRFHRTRERPWPVLSDLRESGALEDEADFVLLLDPDPHAERSTPGANDGEHWIVVAKNRNGPRARIPIEISASGRLHGCALETAHSLHQQIEQHSTDSDRQTD